MVERKEPKIISGWAISVTWDDGTEELIADMPSDVASCIDGWLDEYQFEVNNEVVGVANKGGN